MPLTLGEIAAKLELPLKAVPLERMVKADVIVKVTSSPAASLLAADVAPGSHLACMGTETKGKQEVEATLPGHPSVFADEVAQSVSIGKTQHAALRQGFWTRPQSPLWAMYWRDGTRAGRRRHR